MTALLAGGHGLLLVGVLLVWLRQRDADKAHDRISGDLKELGGTVAELGGKVDGIAGELTVLRPIVERRLTARSTQQTRGHGR